MLKLKSIKLEGIYIIKDTHKTFWGEMHKSLLIVYISGERLKDCVTEKLLKY